MSSSWNALSSSKVCLRDNICDCPKIDPYLYWNQLPKSPGTQTFALWKFSPLGLGLVSGQWIWEGLCFVRKPAMGLFAKDGNSGCNLLGSSQSHQSHALVFRARLERAPKIWLLSVWIKIDAPQRTIAKLRTQQVLRGQNRKEKVPRTQQVLKGWSWKPPGWYSLYAYAGDHKCVQCPLRAVAACSATNRSKQGYCLESTA